MRKNWKEENLSEALLKASYEGKIGLCELMRVFDFSTIRALERAVIKQFHSLEEEKKANYVENLLKADNISLVKEIKRIAINGYSIERYRLTVEGKSKEKAIYMFQIYEEFCNYSDLANLKERVDKNYKACPTVKPAKNFIFHYIRFQRRVRF